MLTLGVVGLVMSACGSDDSKSSDTTTVDTAAPTTGASTTEPPAESLPELPGTGAGAAIVPSVVCIDMDSLTREVAFAYVNEGDAVVLGADDSTVENGEEADLFLVPTVFAPGTVSPAFFVSPTDMNEVTLPAWTVVGPDGETRTAQADASTPECTDELLASTTPDDRQPAFTFSSPVLTADGTGVEFTSELVGVPELSVCPEGLTAEPVLIVTDNGADPSMEGYMSFDGPVGEWTRPFLPDTGGGPTNEAVAGVAATVFDQCSFDGTTQIIWPGGAFEEIYDGVLVCVPESTSELVLSTDEDDPSCSGIPGTGGGRTRPA